MLKADLGDRPAYINKITCRQEGYLKDDSPYNMFAQHDIILLKRNNLK